LISNWLERGRGEEREKGLFLKPRKKGKRLYLLHPFDFEKRIMGKKEGGLFALVEKK